MPFLFLDLFKKIRMSCFKIFIVVILEFVWQTTKRGTGQEGRRQLINNNDKQPVVITDTMSRER